MASTTTKITGITPEGRLSYPHLFDPRDRGDGKKTWDCVVMWPEGTDLSELEAHLKQVAEAKFGVGALRKKGLVFPIKRSSNSEKEYMQAEAAGYPENCSWATFSAKKAPRPVLFDKKSGKKITEDDGEIFYPGCWVSVKYDCYAYDIQQKGVNFGLIAVCKVREDDRFAGRSVDEDSIAREFGVDPVAAGVTDAVFADENASWA